MINPESELYRVAELYQVCRQVWRGFTRYIPQVVSICGPSESGGLIANYGMMHPCDPVLFRCFISRGRALVFLRVCPLLSRAADMLSLCPDGSCILAADLLAGPMVFKSQLGW